MTRWRSVAGDDSGEDYQRRFDALAATGASVHGEADFVARTAARGARVLDAGCGTGRVAIELSRRAFDVVGVDVDPSMLAVARRAAPHLTWLERDLATLNPAELGAAFDVVLLAGNVVPLLESGTESAALKRLAACLRTDGLLVAGFGLDVAHLPLEEVPVTIDDYDASCARHGLSPVARFSTWDGTPFDARAGYAVSVHQRSGPALE
jgi:SAM-dependent methyltransferase